MMGCTVNCYSVRCLLILCLLRLVLLLIVLLYSHSLNCGFVCFIYAIYGGLVAMVCLFCLDYLCCALVVVIWLAFTMVSLILVIVACGCLISVGYVVLLIIWLRFVMVIVLLC